MSMPVVVRRAAAEMSCSGGAASPPSVPLIHRLVKHINFVCINSKKVAVSVYSCCSGDATFSLLLTGEEQDCSRSKQNTSFILTSGVKVSCCSCFCQEETNFTMNLRCFLQPSYVVYRGAAMEQQSLCAVRKNKGSLDCCGVVTRLRTAVHH